MNFFKLAQVVGIVCTTMIAIASGSLADMAYDNDRLIPSVLMWIGAGVAATAVVAMIRGVCGLQTQVNTRQEWFKIRVSNDDNEPSNDFTILATCSLDARIIAFMMDGGFGLRDEAEPILGNRQIELAIKWTEVIK